MTHNRNLFRVISCVFFLSVGVVALKPFTNAISMRPAPHSSSFSSSSSSGDNIIAIVIGLLRDLFSYGVSKAVESTISHNVQKTAVVQEQAAVAVTFDEVIAGCPIYCGESQDISPLCAPNIAHIQNVPQPVIVQVARAVPIVAAQMCSYLKNRDKSKQREVAHQVNVLSPPVKRKIGITDERFARDMSVFNKLMLRSVYTSPRRKQQIKQLSLVYNKRYVGAFGFNAHKLQRYVTHNAVISGRKSNYLIDNNWIDYYHPSLRYMQMQETRMALFIDTPFDKKVCKTKYEATLSMQAQDYLKLTDLDIVHLDHCYGTEIQKNIHAECASLIEHAAKQYYTHGNDIYIALASQCGQYAAWLNKMEAKDAALGMADMGWLLLDASQHIVHGNDPLLVHNIVGAARTYDQDHACGPFYGGIIRTLTQYMVNTVTGTGNKSRYYAVHTDAINAIRACRVESFSCSVEECAHLIVQKHMKKTFVQALEGGDHERMMGALSGSPQFPEDESTSKNTYDTAAQQEALRILIMRQDMSQDDKLDALLNILSEEQASDAHDPYLSEERRAFLDEQVILLKQVRAGNSKWSHETYDISTNLHLLCSENGIPIETFTQLYGNQLQHFYHAEINKQLERLMQSPTLKDDFLQKFMLDFASLAQENISLGYMIDGGALYDALWWSTDMILAIGEGVELGVYNTAMLAYRFATAPVQTTCDMMYGLGHTVYVVGKAWGQEMAHAELMDSLEYTHDITAVRRLIKKSNKERIVLPAIKTLSEMPAREIVKHGTAMFVESLLLKKGIGLAGRAGGCILSTAEGMTVETLTIFNEALQASHPSLVLETGGITEGVIAKLADIALPVVEVDAIANVATVGAFGNKVSDQLYLAQDMQGSLGNIKPRKKKNKSVKKTELQELGVKKELKLKLNHPDMAHNVHAQDCLDRKLRALEKAKIKAVKIKKLSDGRVRYYGVELASDTPGPTKGAAFVLEYNKKTGQVRTWNECYDKNGIVNRVHPKMIDGQTLNSLHYPLTKTELDYLNLNNKKVK